MWHKMLSLKTFTLKQSLLKDFVRVFEIWDTLVFILLHEAKIVDLLWADSV